MELEPRTESLTMASIAQRTVGFLARSVGLPAYTGAGNGKAMRGWYVSGGDAQADSLASLDTLRDRSRDLYRNNPIANGAIKTIVSNVIGTGLRMQSRVDREFLGLSDEQADLWEAKTERLFRVWAQSHFSDQEEKQNFYEAQKLILSSVLQTGEAFVLLPVRPRQGESSQLRYRIIDSDRVDQPPSMAESDRISQGVETDSLGKPIAYYISDRHPGSAFPGVLAYNRILRAGPRSGRLLVLHLFTCERPEQRRGVPFLSPVILSLKQLGRFTEAELMGAVLQSYLTMIVKPKDSADLPGTTNTGHERYEQRTEAGLTYTLNPGDDVELPKQTRPNDSFDQFITSMLKQIGMSLEIPFEVLIKHFNSSYSASRAAMLDAWRSFRAKRAWFAANFCQVLYEEFLFENILRNRIDAPNFFTSAEAKAAWCSAEWVGPSPGQLDPIKETMAAKLRIENNLSTYSRESAELNGTDFERNIQKLRKERSLIGENNLTVNGKQSISKNDATKNSKTT